MIAYGVKTLIFSSSAMVYGDPATVPITEEAPLRPTNPYGQTKLVVENLLRGVFAADPSWRISILRYFNPVGAHPSGEIGESPLDTPNNLMPLICQVCAGRRDRLKIFGNDYPMRDGTGVRDYVHVVDVARGHLTALDYLASVPQLVVHNLGTGRGYSVLEVLSAFETASGRTIPFKIVAARDVAECYADPTRAQQELDWVATHDLNRMCEDAWIWQMSTAFKIDQGY